MLFSILVCKHLCWDTYSIKNNVGISILFWLLRFRFNWSICFFRQQNAKNDALQSTLLWWNRYVNWRTQWGCLSVAAMASVGGEWIYHTARWDGELSHLLLLLDSHHTRCSFGIDSCYEHHATVNSVHRTGLQIFGLRYLCTQISWKYNAWNRIRPDP